jgi:YD repeat-containing protein
MTSDVTEFRWKVFTYDAYGRYIEEIDAPGGQLAIDLNTLNERNPDTRVRYLVARETTRPVPRETR